MARHKDELPDLSCSLKLTVEPEDMGLADIKSTEAPSSSSIRVRIRQSLSLLSRAPARATARRADGVGPGGALAAMGPPPTQVLKPLLNKCHRNLAKPCPK